MRPIAHLALVPVLLFVLLTGTSAQSPSPRDVKYYADLSTVRDDGAIRRLMRRQAETGDLRAMVDYAALLRNTSTFAPGEDLRFHAEAERFDRVAAERGDPLAQVNMGVWCLRNQLIQVPPGVCRSDVDAVRWFRLAMDGGNATATAYYGYMVEFGRGGLTKDPKLAARYYAEAGRRGDFHGGRFLEDMEKYADRRPRGPNP